MSCISSHRRGVDTVVHQTSLKCLQQHTDQIRGEGHLGYEQAQKLRCICDQIRGEGHLGYEQAQKLPYIWFSLLAARSGNKICVRAASILRQIAL